MSSSIRCKPTPDTLTLTLPCSRSRCRSFCHTHRLKQWTSPGYIWIWLQRNLEGIAKSRLFKSRTRYPYPWLDNNGCGDLPPIYSMEHTRCCWNLSCVCIGRFVQIWMTYVLVFFYVESLELEPSQNKNNIERIVTTMKVELSCLDPV